MLSLITSCYIVPYNLPPICLIEFDKQIRKDNSTDMQENNTHDKTVDNIKYILDYIYNSRFLSYVTKEVFL